MYLYLHEFISRNIYRQKSERSDGISFNYPHPREMNVISLDAATNQLPRVPSSLRVYEFRKAISQV